MSLLSNHTKYSIMAIHKQEIIMKLTTNILLNADLMQYMKVGNINDYPIKLTTVSVSANNKRIQTFAPCYMVDGRAVLPDTILQGILKQLGVKDGQAYCYG